MKKNKNIVLIHLESLSNLIYRQNPGFFPHIKSVEKMASTYMNYYSSATSTAMVVTDLMFQTMECFENADYLENVYGRGDLPDSLIDMFCKKGYVGGVFLQGIDMLRLANTISKLSRNWYGISREEFKKQFEFFVRQDEPFFAFVMDTTSHITWVDESDNKESDYQRFEARYHRIDETVGNVIDILNSSGKLRDTVVVLYGDHGDEYWTHGLHEGYTHAIEPYLDIIHCPLIILDGDQEPTTCDHIVSTIDIGGIIESKIMGKEYKHKRIYAVSRNLFAAQVRKADVFNKSYAVTDARYTMIVSNKGVGLYSNSIDPTNSTNLLKFFRFKNKSLVYNERYFYLISNHYRSFMTDYEREVIIKKYYELQKVLVEFISGLPHQGKIKIIKGRFGKITRDHASWYDLRFKYGKWRGSVRRLCLTVLNKETQESQIRHRREI